jgi:hypothetical protein
MSSLVVMHVIVLALSMQIYLPIFSLKLCHEEHSAIPMQSGFVVSRTRKFKYFQRFFDSYGVKLIYSTT